MSCWWLITVGLLTLALVNRRQTLTYRKSRLRPDFDFSASSNRRKKLAISKSNKRLKTPLIRHFHIVVMKNISHLIICICLTVIIIFCLFSEYSSIFSPSWLSIWTIFHFHVYFESKFHAGFFTRSLMIFRAIQCAKYWTWAGGQGRLLLSEKLHFSLESTSRPSGLSNAIVD